MTRECILSRWDGPISSSFSSKSDSRSAIFFAVSEISEWMSPSDGSRLEALKDMHGNEFGLHPTSIVATFVFC